MRTLTTVLIVLSLTSGCASSSRVQRWIRLGMAPQAVIKRMGDPQKRLDTPAGEIWIYRGGRRIFLFDHDNKLMWLQ